MHLKLPLYWLKIDFIVALKSRVHLFQSFVVNSALSDIANINIFYLLLFINLCIKQLIFDFT